MAACSPLLLGSTDFGVDFNARVLAAQNAERESVGVPPLAWDERLAENAREWAVHLVASGRFEHSDDRPDQEQQGENLWGGTPRAYSPEPW